MKNVCKKLFSLFLVAVMLVSVLPMTAMAADGDVHGNVKLKDGTELATIYASTGATIDEYWRYALQNAGENPDNYEATKRWISNSETGSNGNDKLPGNHTISVVDTKISVIVQRKDVTVKVNVYNETSNSSESHTFTVPYGTTFTVNDKILSKVGYNLSDIVLYRFDGYSIGSTITANGWTELNATITTTLKGDSSTDLDKPDGGNETDAKAINWEVRADGWDTESDSFVPAKDNKTTIENILNYKYSHKNNWAEKYDFSHYTIGGKKVENGKLSDTVYGGQTVVIRLNPKTTSNPSNPSNPGTTAVKDLTVNVKYGSTVKSTKISYPQGTVVQITRDLIKKANSAWTNYNISKIEEVNYGGTYDLGDSITMNVHKALTFTLKDSSTGTSNKGEIKSLWLQIYTGKNFDYSRRVEIGRKGEAGYDGSISLEDVKTIVKKYYTAKDSDGIAYDGIYIIEGDTIGNWKTDTKYSKITDLDDMRAERTLVLGVWIDNAKAKTTSNADSSNPKTGDSIFMTMTVMTLSVSALAVLVLANKKRMVK